MTVLQRNTASGVSSNRFGKYVIGGAMVVVGLAAAFGISQVIDDTEPGTATATQSSSFETNLAQKQALEGFTGASVAADQFRHSLAQKQALEGQVGSSTAASGNQMSAQVAAGTAYLDSLNQAGRGWGLEDELAAIHARVGASIAAEPSIVRSAAMQDNVESLGEYGRALDKWLASRTEGTPPSGPR
ncbi:MAG TPA: hypothetical protein VI141_00065 [Acidimicrobiia bacterium]